MSDPELPDYEVEFIPAERRLLDRRSAQPSDAYIGRERRRSSRRDDDASAGGGKPPHQDH